MPSYLQLLAPTELWLWGAVVTDVVLTAVLSYNLRKMKRGFNRSYVGQRSSMLRLYKLILISPQIRTDEFISGLIYLSFGTCAAPMLFSLFTAVCYAATYRLDTLWNVSKPADR